MREDKTDSSRGAEATRPMTTRPRDQLYGVGTLATVLQLLKLPDGTVKVLVEGAERARLHRLHAARGILRGLGRGHARARHQPRRGRGPGAHGGHPVRELCEAQQEGAAGGGRHDRPDHRLCQACRHGGCPSRHQDSPTSRRLLEMPSVDRPAGEGLCAHGGRNFGAAGREAHPLARQAADGEDPARVLSQRADEGDPEGAGRWRRARRARTSSRQRMQEHQVLQGSARARRGGDEEAPPDEPDVGRGDGRAQLSRLAARHSVGPRKARSSAI